MAKVDYAAMAPDLLERIGGEANVTALSHCATRMRFVLKDESKADTTAIKTMSGVVTVVQAGGQYQVVIGTDVPLLFAQVQALLPGLGSGKNDGSEGGGAPSRNPLDAFIALVSAIFAPVLWTLAGTGLFKAFLAMFATLNWIDEASDTYTVLYAASDAFMNFLPLVLAVTAARHFKANQFTAMAIAGALVYPSIVAMNDGGAHTFLGIPLVIMSYTSSVLPIIVAVWVQSYVERVCDRVFPSAFRNFMTPWISVLVMAPLTLLTIGPLTTTIADGIASGVQLLFIHVPLLGGIVIGGFWQVIVMFGLHWGLVPIMTQEITTNGYSLIYGPIGAAVLAQAAAGLAVMIRTRDAKVRELAGPASLSGFLAGVTEPIIYGINLPRKLPFYFGILGGAVGGAIGAIAGGRVSQAGVFPSLIAIPAYLETPHFILWLIGVIVGVAIAFILTFMFGVKDDADAAPGEQTGGPAGSAATTGSRAAEPTNALVAPVGGSAVPLERVKDPVFSSGALGNGVGIVPASGRLAAPAAGTVVTAMETGHAFGIKTDDGVEILIHVGIDTVNLKGAGFTPRVAVGDRVGAGDPLVDVDLEAVNAAGYDTTTIVVITSTASLGAVVPIVDGDVRAGETIIEIDR
ncbi:beta-glucoside-specific PTS transporter subunit IIABC [Actinomyces gaoshouyii]|uniref:beta-glucoside-specific PTS transporter subunit IIABC n=1 Tax=Actinomyces gaoshouyii TaxID=1960083 RepID=UPI0009C1A190|nr:beta-glucoside-specific PTS transporter subunit IIABC [Actinomyces gaoshouyii]ARD41729.1 PTS beta-glucoside transporter subunit EIIBCA [Actinomyces gaoshouyii]